MFDNIKVAVGAGVFTVALIGGSIIGIMKTERIPAGEVGVVYNTQGVEDRVLPTGWHVTNLLDKTIEYPIKMQTVKYTDIKVATIDGKSIEMDFAYNFTIQVDKVSDLFNKFGAIKVEDITDNYLRTRLWNSARSTISKYSVIQVYGEKSEEISMKIQEDFAADIKDLGFTVTGLTLGVPKADKSIQKAIDERVKASQKLEATKTAIKIAEQNAKKAVIEAEGQKKANKILTESLTEEVLTKQWIQKWDGKAPLSTSGSNALIQLPKTK